MSLDLRWLRAFSAVAHQGSFVAAADTLNLSQPALGQQVRKLEQQLDAILLDRHARGARLTAAGAQFLPHADAILQQVATAEQVLRRPPPGRHRKLVLGATPAAARVFGPHIMAACAEELDLELAIRSVMTRTALEQFTQGKLDLIICYQPAPRAARIVPLYQEAFCLVGPVALLPPAADTFSMRALDGIRLILDPSNRLLLEELRGANATVLDVVAEVEPASITPDLLEQSKCCSILSRALFADEIAAGRLGCATIVEPTLERTVYFSARATTLDPYVDQVLRVVTARVAQEVAAGSRGWALPHRSAERPR